MGILMQFLFGVVFIRWEAGRYALQCFSDKVATFLSYGVEGAAFVFGDLLVRDEKVFAFSVSQLLSYLLRIL
ncbi:jg22476 [Pararge aegeria aegeria]|uniref:Jg22476 protein n=1 Tax=Pararge aegeria aegeria TaxID=348720 RepID=A0A8S4SJK6_9NEOP|nr:jg22476 [Pararge aegeria aegeria]